MREQPRLLEPVTIVSALFLIEWGSLAHFVHKGYGAGQLFQFAVVFCSLLAFADDPAPAAICRIGMDTNRH